MPDSPSIEIHTVTVASISRNAMTVPIEITTVSEMNRTIEIPAMIDCGAGGKFIDQSYTWHFEVKKLDQPHQVYNIDGTKNKKGTILSYVDLDFTIDDRKFNWTSPSHRIRETEDNLRVTVAHGAQPQDWLEDRKDGMAGIKKNPWLGQDSPEVQWEQNETDCYDFEERPQQW